MTHIATEEPAFRSCMSVIMIGDVAHVVVEIELAKPIEGDLRDALMHMSQMLDGWLGAMEAPHNHWHFADVTLGNPADVVLVIPGRDARRATEIAAGGDDHGIGGYLGGGRSDIEWLFPSHL
jgi:hypothetical protein